MKDFFPIFMKILSTEAPDTLEYRVNGKLARRQGKTGPIKIQGPD
jgi:hypothetical protein